MGRRRATRLVGHTNFYDEGRDEELHNRMTVELGDDHCRLEVGSVREADGGTVLESAQRPVVQHYARTLAAMRRESRKREVRPVAKPAPAKRRAKYPPNIPACPECGDTRWVDDGTGGGMECPFCGG